MAWHPLAATRWTSATRASMSHDRGQGQRHEAARVGAAPLVDVPVVVGLEHHQREGRVTRLGRLLEGPAAEAGEGGEAHRRQDAVAVHVPDPLVDVVGAGPHLRQRRGVHAPLLLRPGHDAVQAHHAHGGVLEDPLLEPVGVTDQLGCLVLVLRRHVPVEHVGWLDEMVVDTHDDQVVGLHDGVPSLVALLVDAVRVVLRMSPASPRLRWPPTLGAPRWPMDRTQPPPAPGRCARPAPAGGPGPGGRSPPGRR